MAWKNDPYDGICRFDPHYERRKKSSWCGKFSTGKARRVKNSPEYSDDFKAFWEACPKKTGQDTAWKSWSNPDRLPPLHYKQAIKQMKLYALHVADKDQRYVLHPATWINGGHWKDVIEVKNGSKGCVDCGKPWEQGFKYNGEGKNKKYRCPECSKKRNC
jgi:hypothetical protein